MEKPKLQHTHKSIASKKEEQWVRQIAQVIKSTVDLYSTSYNNRVEVMTRMNQDSGISIAALYRLYLLGKNKKTYQGLFCDCGKYLKVHINRNQRRRDSRNKDSPSKILFNQVKMGSICYVCENQISQKNREVKLCQKQK